MSVAEERLKRVSDEKLRKTWTQLQNVVPLYLGLDYYQTNQAKANTDQDFITFIQSIDLTDSCKADYNVFPELFTGIWTKATIPIQATHQSII